MSRIAIPLAVVVVIVTFALWSLTDESEDLAPLQTIATGDLRDLIVYESPRPVPEIAIIGRDGKTHGLGDFGGKVLLVNFWATWCAPCRREMPALERLRLELAGETFEVLTVSTDRGGLERSEKFLAELGVSDLPLYLDESSRAARALGIYGLPTTLLIGMDGHEIGRLVGPAEWDGADATTFLEQVISRENAKAGGKSVGAQ